jgi:transposase-like protein
MTAAAELKILREEIDLLGPRSPSRRYPPEVKARILEWVREQRGAGVGRVEVSDSLSIPWATLSQWLGERGGVKEVAAPAPGEVLQPVRVVQKPPRRGSGREIRPLVLKTPQGFAVEGLDLEGAIALLKRLR